MTTGPMATEKTLEEVTAEVLRERLAHIEMWESATPEPLPLSRYSGTKHRILKAMLKIGKAKMRAALELYRARAHLAGPLICQFYGTPSRYSPLILPNFDTGDIAQEVGCAESTILSHIREMENEEWDLQQPTAYGYPRYKPRGRHDLLWYRNVDRFALKWDKEQAEIEARARQMEAERAWDARIENCSLPGLRFATSAYNNSLSITICRAAEHVRELSREEMLVLIDRAIETLGPIVSALSRPIPTPPADRPAFDFEALRQHTDSHMKGH